MSKLEIREKLDFYTSYIDFIEEKYNNSYYCISCEKNLEIINSMKN